MDKEYRLLFPVGCVNVTTFFAVVERARALNEASTRISEVVDKHMIGAAGFVSFGCNRLPLRVVTSSHHAYMYIKRELKGVVIEE